MGNYKSSGDASKGSPNLEALQYVQENWGKTEIDASLRVNKSAINTVSGTAGQSVTGIPVGAEIIDMVVHANVTSGSGTVTLSVGGGGAAISNAIVMATDKAITRMGTIDNDYKFVTADGLTLTTNADADSGDVFITFKK